MYLTNELEIDEVGPGCKQLEFFYWVSDIRSMQHTLDKKDMVVFDYKCSIMILLFDLLQSFKFHLMTRIISSQDHRYKSFFQFQGDGKRMFLEQF
jgi:hypothetical protein